MNRVEIIQRKVKSLLFYLKLFIKACNETCEGIIFNLRFQINAIYYGRGSQLKIGTVFYPYGGVYNHIVSIKKYSNLKVSLIPDFNFNECKNCTAKFVNSYKIYFEKKIPNGENILHSHVDPWFIDVCFKAKNNGVKWVHTYHTLYFERDWEGGLMQWQNDINDSLLNIARFADIRISISHWLQDFLLEKYKIDTLYIPNGVDVDKCDNANADRFISTFGIKDFVLFASGISDIKNPAEFVKLAHAIPEYKFVIIGRKISIATLFEKYRIPIPENLVVMGQMEHEDLLDAIAACKVFVVTSLSEGLPTVLMEAMALRRTVVGCDTYGTKEVIGTEEHGYIYDHLSFDDLVEKTKLAFLNQKGDDARRRILENYDWKVVIPQIDKIYSELL